jgi:hypothetical protein
MGHCFLLQLLYNQLLPLIAALKLEAVCSAITLIHNRPYSLVALQPAFLYSEFSYHTILCSCEGPWTWAAGLCCRSQKRNINQWRNTHHCNQHQTSEQHEAMDGEGTMDTASVSPRVGSSGISLQQPKFSSDMSPALVAQTNWSFVEKLLKVRWLLCMKLFSLHVCILYLCWRQTGHLWRTCTWWLYPCVYCFPNANSITGGTDMLDACGEAAEHVMFVASLRMYCGCSEIYLWFISCLLSLTLAPIPVNF